jgi:hypothetical protein
MFTYCSSAGENTDSKTIQCAESNLPPLPRSGYTRVRYRNAHASSLGKLIPRDFCQHLSLFSSVFVTSVAVLAQSRICSYPKWSHDFSEAANSLHLSPESSQLTLATHRHLAHLPHASSSRFLHLSSVDQHLQLLSLLHSLRASSTYLNPLHRCAPSSLQQTIQVGH